MVVVHSASPTFEPTALAKETVLVDRKESSIVKSKEITRQFTVRPNEHFELSMFLPLPSWQEAEAIKDKVILEFEGMQCTEGDVLFKLVEAASNNQDLRNLFLSELERRILNGNDPHSALPPKLRFVPIRRALAIYYRYSTQRKNVLPGLFSTMKLRATNVMCVFGGQGNTEDYMGEVQEILEAYEPLIGDLFSQMADSLFQVSLNSIDVRSWLVKRPQDPIIIQSPTVSLSLAGIIQLLNYAILARATGNSLGILPNGFFSCYSGHSQGIVSAVVAAASHSDEEFSDLACKAVKILYFIGLRAQEIHPRTSLPPSILNECSARHESAPTPMLFVSNLSLEQLERHVLSVNSIFPDDRKIFISLHNGPRSFVCSGPAIGLHGLNVALRKVRVSSEEDQSRIPHSKRKLKFTTRFLPISAPFHCPYLNGAVEMIMKDLADNHIHVDNLKLTVPVINPSDGTNLSDHEHLTEELVKLICVKPVHWHRATTDHPSLSHIVDFGPGGTSGIGALTHRNLEGSGVRVILGSTIAAVHEEIDDCRHLFDRNPESVRFGINWKREFGPRVICREADGKRLVETRFSRLLGLPPLMVAGMTPCTVSRTFVSACINAGYHVELAGGGHFTEEMLREKIDGILSDIPVGYGITLNSLFLNPRLWSLQYPLMKKMREEGYPIEGFCVAAGVPSLENANEIVRSLSASGIRHISFKPGGIDSIYQVINIARHNPSIPIILQWTGGRGGGHHSFEDFHQPILETYAAIRSQKNLILVAGSGFGDGPDSLPYLTGQWSERFRYPWMPFDGILLASRLMVAKENQASVAVKDLLVATKGAERETDWEGTYSAPVGSIITVMSELGEPIHKVATRAVLLWRELDDKVFYLPRGEKRMKAIMERKSHWIDRLNSDHLKVWFGRHLDGSICDLEEMTYEEVIMRLLELCYLVDQQRWIDSSYRALIHDFLLLAQSRFCKDGTVLPAMVPASDSLILDPYSSVAAFLASYPEMKQMIIRLEDVDSFLQLCMNPIRKPVPFIPVFDEHFEYWFKKDSLWASEDVDAVPGKDVQRTCILQGPISVKYSTERNNSVKSILDGINDYYVAELSKMEHGKIHSASWFGLADPTKIVQKHSKNHDSFVELCGESVFRPNQLEIDNPSMWLSRLCGNRLDWFTAALESPVVFVKETKRLETNPFLSLFKARYGYSYTVNVLNGQTDAVYISQCEKNIVKVSFSSGTITLLLYHEAERVVPLELRFSLSTNHSPALIQVSASEREEQIRKFYYSIWFGAEHLGELQQLKFTDAKSSPIVNSRRVDVASTKEFCKVVGNHCAAYNNLLGKGSVPMDFAVVIAWKSIIQCLFTESGCGNLLYLVHLRNKITLFSKCIQSDCNIETSAHISSITGSYSHGKEVEVTAECRKDGLVILKIVTSFLYRKNQAIEHYVSHPNSAWRVPIKSEEDAILLADLLRAKNWFQPVPDWHLKVSTGYELTFYIERKLCLSSTSTTGGFDEMEIQGHVTARFTGHLSIPCGLLNFKSSTFIKGDPIGEFCKRHGGIPSSADLKVFTEKVNNRGEMQELGTISAPLSSRKYCQISGDYNPIHGHELIADLLGLTEGPIIHGMWTSAAVRALLECHLAENCPSRVFEYETRFTDMVIPGSQINVLAEHIGMHSGRLVYNFEGRTGGNSGKKVIEGSFVVDQPITAILFTGQGSQRPGMGMDLYEESIVAQNIWDRADEHFLKNFGISIIDIVKNNPKELTVYFGGIEGQQIRRNYMTLSYEDPVSKQTRQLIPQINELSDSYTFISSNGLLHATQFTQPGLTLFAKAAFEDMKANGLVPMSSAFAGHSLGEYASLAAVGDIIPIETLCDIVFYRGLTMQSAVLRDTDGRSDYGMIAVNPSRISPDFNEEALKFMVEGVKTSMADPLSGTDSTQNLLEIVNYNVQDGQYVVAGNLLSLEVLTQTLNFVKHKAINIHEYVTKMPLEELKTKLNEMTLYVAKEVHKKTPVLEVSKGYASVQLTGIDVPFHSSFLLSGVAPFRSILKKKLDPALVSVERLCGRYIPNLVGSVFELTLQFCQKVWDASGSPVIGRIIKSFPELTTDEAKQNLAHTILIELLAYQFASPVQWIRTQDVLFSELKIERIIEIGPAAILSGMAEKTIKVKYAAQDDVMSTKRTVWSFSANRAEIYCEPTRKSKERTKSIQSNHQSDAKDKEIVEQTSKALGPAESSESATVIGQSLFNNPDVSFAALDALRVTLCTKVRKPLKDIGAQKTIKELSGGKSTVQNELLTDLQREFGDSGIPERAEELPLAELAMALTDYKSAPRKHTTLLLNKLWSSKMPSGFEMSLAKKYLEKEYGFGSQSVDSILLFGPSFEPEKRIATEAEVFSWLDSLVQFVASIKEMAIQKQNLALKNSRQQQQMISTAELESLRQEQKHLAKLQLDALCMYMGLSENEDLRRILMAQREQITAFEEKQAEWTFEHGEEYAIGIRPIFSSLKARHYDSYWNWAKQELFTMMFEAIGGKLDRVDRTLMERCRRLINKAEPELIPFMEYHLIRKRQSSEGISKGDTKYQTMIMLGMELLELMRKAVDRLPLFRDLSHPTVPIVTIANNGSIKYSEGLRRQSRNVVQYVAEMERPLLIGKNQGKEPSSVATLAKRIRSNRSLCHRIPLISLRKPDPQEPLHWVFSATASNLLFDTMRDIATHGICLSKKVVLLTGSGKGSIGGEVLKALLSAGAMVVATTSSYSRPTLSYYQQLYEECSGKGSVLVVVPFNQASLRDIEGLVDYIHEQLSWNIDFFLPFAAINENGATMETLSGKNDLAHRIMFTNILKMLGSIVRFKGASGSPKNRPVHCIIPLSPNQGSLGGDGLYGESKASLQTLLQRWTSEQWKGQATIAGAVIGWTRGTSLMSDNNLLAAAVESEFGVRTFSPREMAFNIVSLMHPRIIASALTRPVYADLSGGLSRVSNLSRAASEARNRLISASRLKRALFKENENEALLYFKDGQSNENKETVVRARSRLNFAFNQVCRGDGALGAKLRKLLDLDKVVVIVGFGEVGPWGSSRTRWEMEARGELSLAGYIELAWSMGLIEYQKLAAPGKQHIGWIDRSSKEPVQEWEIPTRYKDYIMKHCGIRPIEPAIIYGYDPNKRETAQEHILTQDLPFFEVSREEAEALCKMHGPQLTDIIIDVKGGRARVRIKKGARVYLPKAQSMDRLVAGLLPTGWDARRFGVPDEIANQVDPCSLYNLVSTCEALVQAGITDPYELYSFCHPSQVGNCSGGGEGGLRSNQRIFKERFFERPAQSDILQETFINTMPAWVNLLLMSSSGPVKSPVGACATAVQSVELGVECITSGKAQVVIVGGYDDISEESSCEFASMQATSNAREEMLRGREPAEQCRPTASSRSGFMESHGAGSQILMSARLAIKMGCPVYGIIAGTNTASDRQGRSIPAPGQGLLITARKEKRSTAPEILNVDYRLKQLSSCKVMNDADAFANEEDLQQIIIRRIKAEKQAFGHDFWKDDTRIAPLEGFLAQFGLDIDSVHMASFHGTGTRANDINESDVLQKQLNHLQRSPGNMLPCVFQKHLTGHPKGAACAWMINGCLQSMNHLIIPGNRNADNIDSALRDKSFLLFLNKSVQIEQLDAALVKSFGFGQVGGEAVIVNPSILYSMLSDSEFDEYVQRRRKRELKAIRYFNNSLLENSLVQVKDSAPYPDALQTRILLDPLARREMTEGSVEWTVAAKMREGLNNVNLRGAFVGVDIQFIPDLESHCPIQRASPSEFVKRNFTDEEIERLEGKPDQPSSLAGMWAGKEAAFKALCQGALAQSLGAGAALLALQIKYSPAPFIIFAERTIKLSISHSGDYAIAIAVIEKQQSTV